MNIEKYIEHDDTELQAAQISIERAMYETKLLTGLCDLVYMESTDDNEEEESKIKTLVNKVIQSVKKFFENIRDFIKNAVKDLKKKLHKEFTNQMFRDKVEAFLDAVEKAEKGKKTFKCFDVKEGFDCIRSESLEYIKLLNKFSSFNLNNISLEDIEKLPEEVEKIHEEHQKKLKEIVNKKREYRYRDAKILYDDLEELRRNKIYGCIDAVDQLEQLTENIEKLITKALDGSLQTDMEHAKDLIAKTGPMQGAVNKLTKLQFSVSSNAINLLRTGYNMLS